MNRIASDWLGYSRGIAILACWTILLSLATSRNSLAALARSTHFDLAPSQESEPGSEGTGLQSGGTFASNLGSFDIVLVPNGALAGNAPALAAFNRAAAQWESVISDPITVTINANLSALGSGIIGSTGSVTLLSSYNTVRNAMVADAADEVDDAITAALPTAAQFAGTLPTGFAFDGNVQATKANFKALGFAGLDAQFGVSDASITFSTNFSFDFDKSNGVTAGTMDFETVAAHEIGHALGFISDVDYVDAVRPGTASDVEPTTLDLFRFGSGVNDPTDALTFTTRPRNMVPGALAHFDQITPVYGSQEVLVSTGLDFGDGNQASHWKDGLGLGVMDPTISFGEISLITANDLRAFDLIGYEIAAIPEAAAWAFGGVAMCVVGMGVCLKKRRQV